MKKSRFAKKMMALILAVVTAVTLMPVNGFMSKVSADETENVKPDYLTFTAKEAGSTITFAWKTGSDVMCSTDGGNNWVEYANGTEIKLDKVGSTVSFKGKNVTTDFYKHFTMNGLIEASGSVTSLTDSEGNKTDVNLSENCYQYMFYECTSLTTAPELPAKQLASYCYEYMFSGCTSLTTAPELPAEQLAKLCYAYMFSKCTSLTTAPELPAKQLASCCYGLMFNGCTSLTTAPELPAEQLAEYCYQSMFSGCTSLTTAPELPAKQLASYCYEYMFSGCTSLKEAPELPAKQLASYCYEYMFSGCTSLTTAPELPAEQLAKLCYAYMFSKCTSLTTAPELPAEQLAKLCYAYMFSECTSLTTAPKLPAEQLESFCYEYMFSGCTSLTTAPKLSAEQLAEYCYAYMFSGCTSLTTAPELPTEQLAEYCYKSMFSGCTSLTTAPELPAEQLAFYCYESMFSKCTSLTTAPELPAEQLKLCCYGSMFSGCTSLKEAPELKATNLAESCYAYMFNGCTELIEAPDLPATNLASYCYLYMFCNCTTLRISTKLDEQHSKKWNISSQANTKNMFSGCTKVDFGNGSHEAKAGETYYTGCNHKYNSKNECIKCHWMNVTIIDSVDMTITAPVPGVAFPTSVTCNTTGVSGCSGFKWTKEDGTEVKADDKVQYGATYYANVTLTKKEGYGFSDTVTITCNGEENPNADCNITGESLNIKIPFWVKANLISITQPQSVQASYGAEKSAEGLGLPETVKIKTESSDITSAPVTWDFKNVKYDPNKDDEQKFEVSGEITLPDTVVNKNNIPLNVKVNVTVSAAKEIKYSATGYEGDYDGQTHGIDVKVTEPADTEILYSTNQVTGSKKNKLYKDAGTYTVYYYINKKGYKPVGGVCNVVIHPKQITATVNADSKNYDGTAITNVSALVDTGIDGEKLSISGLTGTFDNKNAGNDKIVNINSDNAVITGNSSSNNYIISYPSSITASINPRKLEFSWETKSEFIFDEMQHEVNAKITNLVDGETANITYSNDGSNVHTATNPGQYTAKVESIDNPNYTLDGSNNTYEWSIKEFVTDVRATVSGSVRDNGWFTSGTVQLKAPVGYKIRLSDNKSGWQDTAECTLTDGKDKMATYQLMESSTGYVTNPISIDPVKIDSTAPTGTISIKENKFTSLLNTITFKHFFKNSVDVKFNAVDETSGVAKIEYALISNVKDLQSATWKDITEAKKISLAAHTKKAVYARLTDNAGNTAVINSDGIVVYTDAVTEDTVSSERLNAKDTPTNISVNQNTVATVLFDGKDIKENLNDVLMINNSDGKIVLKKSFLETLSAGEHRLTIGYNPFGEQYVSDSNNDAPAESVITIQVNRLDGSVSDIADIGKTYDGTAVSDPEFTTTNARSDKTVTYEYKQKDAADAEYSEAVPVNAGSYTVRITVAEDDNYSKAVSTKDFIITKKPVNIKWSDNEFTYDGKAHKAQADVISDDIVGKDKVSVITTGEQTNAGKYTATATGVDNENYVLSTKADRTHDFSIARKPIKVTADSVQKHVNADDPKFTYTVEANALVIGDTLKDITVERTKGEECGKYDITISAKANSNPNYEITTVDGKLTIADHTYSDTTYTWSADNTECTAVRKCTYCDKTDTETAKSKAEVTQNRSCTLPELTKYTVSFKNENGTAFKAQTKENVQTKEATGHKWDGGVQTKAPTYTDEGEMTYTCESCGATKTESIEKLKLNEYDILEGADTTHVLKVDEAHAIRVNCEVEYFLDVMVDGKTVDPKYYTVKSGSTIITFTKEFLDSLSVGDHEVKFLFTNGTAKATITVVEKQAQETKPADKDKTDINKPATPQKPADTLTTPGKPAQQTSAPAKKPAANQKKATRTGDDNPAMQVLILMLLGGVGAVGYSLKRRKAQ